jgi:hypothetical protein
MRRLSLLAFAFLTITFAFAGFAADDKEALFKDKLDVEPPHISTDKSVKYDYDLVYIRAPRNGDKAPSMWTEIAHPALTRV